MGDRRPVRAALPSPTAAERFPRLDLAALRGTRPVATPLDGAPLPAPGCQRVAGGPAFGVGKSLLLALATTIARGRRAFASLAILARARAVRGHGEHRGRPGRPAGISEVTPETAPDLDRLILLHLPDLALLDTPAGAADLAAMDAYGISRGIS